MSATYTISTGDTTGTMLIITGHLASYGINLYSSNYDAITEVLTIVVGEPLLPEDAEHLELTLVE
jgi:predicted amino acid-binding ACT domain protein